MIHCYKQKKGKKQVARVVVDAKPWQLGDVYRLVRGKGCRFKSIFKKLKIYIYKLQ